MAEQKTVHDQIAYAMCGMLTDSCCITDLNFTLHLTSSLKVECHHVTAEHP